MLPNDQSLAFVVAVLATWRLATLLSYDKGPGNLLLRLRTTLYNKALDRNQKGVWQFLSTQVECFWCSTLIAALVVWPFFVWCPWLLVPLALSGAAVLLSYGGRVIWKQMAEE